MNTPDKLIREAADLYKQGYSQRKAAKLLGCCKSTVGNRWKLAAERGYLGFSPVLPGFRLSQSTDVFGPEGELRAQFVQQKPERGDEFKVPEGHLIKGVSALINEDGREIVKWVKTREGVLDPLQVADLLKKSFEDYKPAAKPKPEPKNVDDDLCTLIPCNDWHLGMYAWGQQTDMNWDLAIASKAIRKAAHDVIERSPASVEGIILIGGDLLHADNQENRTAKSGNQLDVDGRYPKILLGASQLIVEVIDAALLRHEHVTVRILPGNHDEHSAVAVAYFLLAWYKNEMRVTIDVDPSLFWWFRFGFCLFGATHGHTVKIGKMPEIMAHRRAKDWGETKFRYIHGFHLHHTAKFASEGAGVISEIHQAPIPQDAWHFNSGFLSGRSMQAITYHRDYGEVGRVRTALLDDK